MGGPRLWAVIRGRLREETNRKTRDTKNKTISGKRGVSGRMNAVSS